MSKQSSESYRHLYSASYHAAHLSWVKRNKRIYRHYKYEYQDLIKPIKGMRILEFGCSSGKTTCDFASAGCIVTAIDFDPAAIELAKEWAVSSGVSESVSFVCIPAEKFNFVGSDFDAVTMLDFVEHIPDLLLEQTVKNILQSGYHGPLLVYTPNRLHFTEILRVWGILQQDPTHINLKSEFEWVSFFKDRGFHAKALKHTTSHWPVLSTLETFMKDIPFIGRFFTRSLALTLEVCPPIGD